MIVDGGSVEDVVDLMATMLDMEMGQSNGEEI